MLKRTLSNCVVAVEDVEDIYNLYGFFYLCLVAAPRPEDAYDSDVCAVEQRAQHCGDNPQHIFS